MLAATAGVLAGGLGVTLTSQRLTTTARADATTVVVIDAGHTDGDGYGTCYPRHATQTATTCWTDGELFCCETRANLQTAELVRVALEVDPTLSVRLTRGARPDDLIFDEALEPLRGNPKTTLDNRDGPSKSARAAFANGVGASLLVSVHFNGNHDPGVDGTMVMYGKKHKDVDLATVMLEELKTLPHPHVPGEAAWTVGSGVTNFASVILLKADMPAVIVEPCFFTSHHEQTPSVHFKNAAGQDVSAAARAATSASVEGDVWDPLNGLSLREGPNSLRMHQVAEAIARGIRAFLPNPPAGQRERQWGKKGPTAGTRTESLEEWMVRWERDRPPTTVRDALKAPGPRNRRLVP